MSQDLLELMTDAALAAGDVIMDIYAQDFDAEIKGDGSPVTLADQKAEQLIAKMLAETQIPLLGEESAAAGNIPDLGRRFFVVDPLDGTKEFIKRNGQFTVNIALVEDGVPVLGVVLAPDLGVNYRGGPAGAFRSDQTDGQWSAWKTISTTTDTPHKIVGSLSHRNPVIDQICESLDVNEQTSIGSSLKFCLVAEGAAQYYPRLTPTCEWDTAAGHAVLNAAGGAIAKLDGSPLTYGKQQEKFLNPFFAAAANAALAASCAKVMNEVL